MTETRFTPGPWEIGYRTLTVQAPSEKGDTFPLCDIRGWGYLTGHGSGALGLAKEAAAAIQDANAALIAAAPDLYEALSDLVGLIEKVAPEYAESPMASNARIALSKARSQPIPEGGEK